jgi:two-component system, response regulator PdtaR
MRVLVLEADWWVAALLGDALTAAGHEVVGLAPSLAAALALAEEAAPDVAVVARDLGQGHDGSAAVRLLRERYGCPAVLTADRLDHDDAVRAAAPAAYILRSGNRHELLVALGAAQAETARGPALFDGVALPVVPPDGGTAEG